MVFHRLPGSRSDTDVPSISPGSRLVGMELEPIAGCGSLRSGRLGCNGRGFSGFKPEICAPVRIGVLKMSLPFCRSSSILKHFAGIPYIFLRLRAYLMRFFNYSKIRKLGISRNEHDAGDWSTPRLQDGKRFRRNACSWFLSAVSSIRPMLKRSFETHSRFVRK